MNTELVLYSKQLSLTKKFAYPNKYYMLKLLTEYQFVYPTPKGSELIIPAPFRDGVVRDNEFAYWH